MYGKIQPDLRQELDAVAQAGLYREERVIVSPQIGGYWGRVQIIARYGLQIGFLAILKTRA